MCFRAKKLQKQLDKVQLQFTESKAQIRDLKLQLSDAGDCKVSVAVLYVSYHQTKFNLKCISL